MSNWILNYINEASTMGLINYNIIELYWIIMEWESMVRCLNQYYNIDLNLCMLDYFLVTGYDIVETEAFSNLFLDEYLIGSVLFDYNNISIIFNSIEDDSNLSFLFYFVLYKSYFLDIPNSIWRLWRLIVYWDCFVWDWDYDVDYYFHVNEYFYAQLTWFNLCATTSSTESYQTLLYEDYMWDKDLIIFTQSSVIYDKYDYYFTNNFIRFIYVNMVLFDTIIKFLFFIIINILSFFIFLLNMISFEIFIEVNNIINTIFLDLYLMFNNYEHNWCKFKFQEIDLNFFFFFFFVLIINCKVLLICKKIFIESFFFIIYFFNFKKIYFTYFSFPSFTFKISLFGIPNNIFGKYNYTWYKFHKKCKNYFYSIKNNFLTKIIYYYKNQKGFTIKNTNTIGFFLLSFSMISVTYAEFIKWKVRAIDTMIKVNLMEKHNKIFLKHNIIINSYLTFFLPIVIKKIFKINFFFFTFMFKFFFYKLLKLIFSLIVYNKSITILIYYYLNFKLIIKNISNFFFFKIFMYYYLKIKIHKIYYIRMHLHFTIYKYISKVFFSKAYYINTEMADKFPYFQSEFISKVIKFLNPINKLKHIYLINVISLFGNYLAFFFFFFFNIIYIIFDKFIKIVYYIFIAKIKLFKTVYQNNLSYYKIFWLFFFCYIFLSLYIYGLLYYIILFYFFISILSLCFNKWLWFLGFLFCFFLDIINIILSKMVNIFIKVFKFLFIYPFFLFLFLFFFYNNSVLSFYFFDFIQIHLIYIYECMYVILNNLIDYYTIVYLPVNYNIFFNKLQTIYNNYNLVKEEYNNIDWNLLSILREKELLPKVKGEFVIFVIFDSIDYIYNIFDYVWDNFIKNIKITIKYFYYYLMVKSIYLFNSIFWSYKFLMDYRKDQFAFIMINIYFDTYKELIKIFIYNKILIDLPYFIIQPILNFIITIYEYSITFKYLLNIMANIKYISIIFYTIIEGLNIYICNIFSTFIYSTLCIAKISYWFCDIFFYFIIDIIFNLNGYFLIDWLYLYTNIDFLFYNIYSKFINFKDGIFSWFRFPIKNSVLLNKKFLLFQHFESHYWEEDFIFEWTNETNVRKTNGSLFFIDRYSEMPFWLQLLQYKPTNFIAFSYKIHKFYKAFSSFPFLWFFFWFYYIYIYLILIIFLFNIYSKLFKDNNELYKSNIHNWDLIRENAINSNFSWYKKNTNLNNYYYKEIIKTKEIRAIKKNDNFMIDKNLMSDDKIIDLNRIKMNNKNIFSLKKMLKKKKINYLIFFKKYNMFKNKIEKFRKIKNKKLKFKKIYYKFLNFYKNIKSYKNFNKNITFNFKNFMINNKFNILYNFFLIEKKKFNLFSLYYYKKNKHIPFIYEHWFEENFAEGPIIFNINEKDYIYLKNTLFNLFQFFKWFDNSFFNKKGSIYFFHKDPTVCYVGNDKFNIKYYFNSSLDSDSYNTNNVAIIFFIFFPIFIIINLLLSDMLHIEHVDEDSFFYVFGEYIFYWLCWFFIQFEYLHDSLITFMFGSLECRLNNIEPHYDSAYGGQPTWFHYDKMVKKFFPLYSYYKSKILLYQVFDSRENSSFFNDIWKFFETLYFYICNVYDIVYIKFNILNFYSFKIFFYFILKIIIYIYIIVIIYYNRNFKIFKFFLYSKKNLNMLNFMNKLINNKVNNLKKIWNKNL